MKKIYSTINTLFRRDNVKTWLPMMGSFAGIFLTPGLDLIIRDDPNRFFQSFLVGCLFGLIYLLLVFRYVRQTHSIHNVLRSDKALWTTCSYLANLQGNKATNNYKLQKLHINYTFEEPVRNSIGVLTYPFSVEYIVGGYTTNQLSEIYYHTIGATHKDKHVKVEYAFDDGEYCLAGESNCFAGNKSITYYKFCSEVCYQRHEVFSYRIRITYDEERGISVCGKQCILFDPTNLTPNCREVKALLRLNCPDNVEKNFDMPHIHQFIDGLNQIPNAGQMRMSRKNYDRNQHEYECDLEVEYNRLYALMFIAPE